MTVEGTGLGAVSHDNGEYVITHVPVGARTIRVRIVGYRPQALPVTVAADQRAAENFTMVEDPLSLSSVVVTGTATPRVNEEASVAISTLTSELIDQAAPRSTTEMLRYVPGFTRVESSGGEVNENITMRGILGVEYVMFMEDGLPVFPTMHTFFMNADNLFRPDENIDEMEVVRGGSSAYEPTRRARSRTSSTRPAAPSCTGHSRCPPQRKDSHATTSTPTARSGMTGDSTLVGSIATITASAIRASPGLAADS